MLLCRVLLGNVHVVASNTAQNDAEKYVCASDGTVNGQVDSVLGRMGSSAPREFLVYKIDQIYPEYILYYKA